MDPQAQAMKQIVNMISTKGDWQSVIAYIASIPPSAKTREDVTLFNEKGRLLYAACVACHGAKGQGVKALGAPALAPLPAWYIAEQLRKFRDGSRGMSPQDAQGQQMRAIAAVLQSDNDVSAVASYIQGSLGS